MIYCPRCEKPLDGHDEGACARRMSRRFFFGVVGGGLVAAQAIVAQPEAPRVLTVWGTQEGDWVFTVGPVAHPHGLPPEFRLIYEASIENTKLAPSPSRILASSWTDVEK